MGAKQSFEMFNCGYNCAQSVIAAYCEKYGIDKKTALLMACGFGGGMKCGEICGAVSGAVMVVGLKYGGTEVGDEEAKAVCNSKTKEFVKRFKDVHGKLICREILEKDNDVTIDVEIPENSKRNPVCFNAIHKAVKTLNELGY